MPRSRMDRRTFLGLLGAAGIGAALPPWMRAVSAAPSSENEYFIFFHAVGGWDIQLWSDPRTAPGPNHDPPDTHNTDSARLRLWQDDGPALPGGARSFRVVQPPGCNIPFGPGIGNLLSHGHYSRLCVINGLAMNTVSHATGITYAVTGRPAVDNRPLQSSVDAMVADALGTEQLIPAIALSAFPSALVGNKLDRRAAPLLLTEIGMGQSLLRRADRYETAADRSAVAALLARETADLVAGAAEPEPLRAFEAGYHAVDQLIARGQASMFDVGSLNARYGQLLPFDALPGMARDCAFAAEAFRFDVARCVSFAQVGFDTHGGDHYLQGWRQQAAFDLLAALLEVLDRLPHPRLDGHTIGDHVHILATSDFGRTPLLNERRGRDHHATGSALIISPRVRGNFVFGGSDPDQMMPLDVPIGGRMRPVTPSDLLATYLTAFGLSASRYLSQGEIIRDVLPEAP